MTAPLNESVPGPGGDDQLFAAIGRFLRLLFRPGDVFEVRAPKCRHRGASTYTSTSSGYYAFDSIDAAVRDVVDLDSSGHAPGIYVTLNPVRPDLLARAANRLKPKASETTADHDVPHRRHMLVDADAIRASGTSSTDGELAAAETVVRRIVADLSTNGWPEPILGMSGNGWHAIYAVELPGDDGGLVEGVLMALAARYNDDRVKVDVGVYNPARITKVLGTVARKGDDLRGVVGVEDRPHRRSRLISAPSTMVVVPGDLLVALASEFTHARKVVVATATERRPGAKRGGGKGPFERFEHTAVGVAGYLERHGVAVKAVVAKPNATILHLERCPVVADCMSEGDSDISVIIYSNGGIAYKNQHARGKDLDWFDVRDVFEPGYREHRDRRLDDEREAGEKLPAPAQRDGIVRLARSLYRLGRSPAGEAFAVPTEGPNVALMLRAGQGSLRAQLSLRHVQATGRVPDSSSLADAMLTLEGLAQQADPEPVHLRLGRDKESIIIDLGDATGRAIVVDATGWRLVERSPILFRRSPLTGALPTPVAGGSLETLRPFINISGPSWHLTLGWLVAAMIPDIEHPIALLGGQQDSGKSTTGRFLAGLIDPSPAALRAPPKDVEQWAVSAVGSWIVVVDNISGIAEWLSDALCRAVTGDGLIRRLLFSSEDVSVLVFQRCIILTSIDAGGLKGDLGRRLVVLDLEPIDRKKKRRPRVLRSEYEACLPGVLGALLDLLAQVLGRMPHTTLDEFEGLADFEHVLASVDGVLGTDSLSAYRAQWERIAAEVVEGDIVAVAVQGLARRSCQHQAWVGTAGALLQELSPAPRPKDWPSTPRALGGMLRRLIPALRVVGVELVPPSKTNKERTFEIRLIDPTAPIARQPESGVHGAQNGETAVRGTQSPPPGGATDGPINAEPSVHGLRSDLVSGDSPSNSPAGLDPRAEARADFEHEEGQAEGEAEDLL